MKVIAIVGRPNVGKSTLFNRLTKTKNALVVDLPGVTRDRQYGQCDLNQQRYIIIDTGGIADDDQESLAYDVSKQADLAMLEADIVLFMVDGRAGLTSSDEKITMRLRRLSKPCFLLVNKIDGVDEHTAKSEFFSLGFSEVIPIAAAANRGLVQLAHHITEACPSDPIMEPVELLETKASEESEDFDHIQHEEIPSAIKVAFIGRPNAGKSTLINRLLGDERVIVSPEAGTTRDSIEIPFEHRDKQYILIDTAGIRRKSKVKETVEKFSVVKTLQAIQSCHVAVFLVNAQEDLVDQDLHLLGSIIEAGKALVIAVNKWDGLDPYQRDLVKRSLMRKLEFAKFAKIKFISALHGTGVGELYPLIQRAFKSAMIRLKTPEVNELLEAIIAQNPPPLAGTRRVKFRYAHMGGRNPPTIVIHGVRLSSVTGHYQRYLTNAFREALKLEGTPVQIKFVDDR